MLLAVISYLFHLINVQSYYYCFAALSEEGSSSLPELQSPSSSLPGNQSMPSFSDDRLQTFLNRRAHSATHAEVEREYQKYKSTTSRPASWGNKGSRTSPRPRSILSEPCRIDSRLRERVGSFNREPFPDELMPRPKSGAFERSDGSGEENEEELENSDEANGLHNGENEEEKVDSAEDGTKMDSSEQEGESLEDQDVIQVEIHPNEHFKEGAEDLATADEEDAKDEDEEEPVQVMWDEEEEEEDGKKAEGEEEDGMKEDGEEDDVFDAEGEEHGCLKSAFITYQCIIHSPCMHRKESCLCVSLKTSCSKMVFS